jgi:hypothetical protein
MSIFFVTAETFVKGARFVVGRGAVTVPILDM